MNTVKYEYHMGNSELLQLHTDPQGAFKAGTGATIWDSGLVLAKYCETVALDQNIKHVVELGSGCGIVGLVLSRLLPKAEFILTDQPAVIKLLQKTVDNGDFSNVELKPLVWGGNCLEFVKHGYPDLIIFSDLITWPELYDDLIKTILQLAGTKTKLLFANEKRNFEHEARFYAKLGGHFSFSYVKPEDQHPVYQSEDIYLFNGFRK